MKRRIPTGHIFDKAVTVNSKSFTHLICCSAYVANDGSKCHVRVPNCSSFYSGVVAGR